MREIRHIYEIFNPQFWLIKEQRMLSWGKDVVSMSTTSITTREDVDWDGSVGKSRTIELVSDYPESRVQFVVRRNTGLKDKQDREIYEGDILKIYNESFPVSRKTSVVKWNNRTARFTGLSFQQKRDRVCVVIGNIYENKDLLK